MTTQHGTLPDVAFPYSIGLGVPSQTEFQRLRQLRLVSHEIRDAVDQRLRDPIWKAVWLESAKQFRRGHIPGDLPQPLAQPGLLPDAGVWRLIRAGRYDVLATRMQEYAMDGETQQVIMAILRQHLTVIPGHADTAYQRRSAATAANMHRAIAQAMRLHLDNQILVDDACKVLSWLHHVIGISCRLRQYIFATLIPVMENHSTNPMLQSDCLMTCCTILSNDEAEPFVTVGSSNMITLTCHSMTVCPDISNLRVGCQLLDRFCTSINTVTHAQTMLAVDVAATERIICESMQRHPSDVTINLTGLGALSQLHLKYPGRMHMHVSTARCAGNALVSHMRNEKVAENVFNTLIHMLPHFHHAGIDLDAVTIIPLAVAAMRCHRNNRNSKRIGTRLLFLLCELCQSNPQNVPYVVNCNAVEVLVDRYEDVQNQWGMAAAWLQLRARLQALTLPVQQPQQPQQPNV